MTIDQIAASAIETAKAIVNESGEVTKEQANQLLDALESDLAQELAEQVLSEAKWTTAFINDLPDASFAVIMAGGEKDDDGKTAPRSLRKLPYKDAGGAVDIPHLRNALARLPQMKGVSAELKAKARKTLQAAAKKHLKTQKQEEAAFSEAVSGSLRDFANRVEDAFRAAFKPDTVSSAEMPSTSSLWTRDVFKDHPDVGDAVIVSNSGQLYAVEYKEVEDGFEFASRDNWRKARLTYVLEPQEETEEVTEAELAESAAGAAISLVEAEPSGNGVNPLQLDIVVIEPGWGNKKDMRYYGREMLERDAGMFKGAKMHAVGHDPNKKDVRTEVSQVLECPVGFTEDGAPIARVGVFDESFAQSIRNRAALDTLSDLHCSILGSGSIRKGKAPDGKKGNIVESITEVTNVDWVMKAGAGGHAHNLAEDSGGNDMTDEEKKVKEEEGAEKEEKVEGTTEVQETEVVTLAESEVETALEATNLPGAFKTALAGSEYASPEALQEAITEAVADVKKLTGSGQVFGQGGTQPVEDKPLSEADKIRRFNEIMDEVGMARVPVPAE